MKHVRTERTTASQSTLPRHAQSSRDYHMSLKGESAYCARTFWIAFTVRRTIDVSWFEFRKEQENFLFPKALSLAIGLTQPSTHRQGLLPLFVGKKKSALKAHHSFPPTAEIKMAGAISPLPHTTLWRFKRPIHSHLNWAILLCDVIPDGKNWVNCAILTGNSAGFRTVLTSRLSHRELRSSLRESHKHSLQFFVQFFYAVKLHSLKYSLWGP
jgi:hypothetical protein